jgi:hypothetical protein
MRFYCLIFSYKIRNNDSPFYLYDCLLPFIRDENEINLRNQSKFRNSLTILQLFTNSLFPSIKSWNKLSSQIRNAPTLNRFQISIQATGSMSQSSVNYI